jgi:hypothetical protein
MPTFIERELGQDECKDKFIELWLERVAASKASFVYIWSVSCLSSHEERSSLMEEGSALKLVALADSSMRAPP